jgi:hypothetical protein
VHASSIGDAACIANANQVARRISRGTAFLRATSSAPHGYAGRSTAMQRTHRQRSSAQPGARQRFSALPPDSFSSGLHHGGAPTRA